MSFLKKIFILGIPFLMGGCSLLQTDKNEEPPVFLKEVNISLDADANQDSALAIDLLMIYKKELLDTVMKMKARDYFVSALQLKRDYPEMVDIWHWELTPGQVVKKYPVFHRPEPVIGAVFFADYLTAGDHRVRFGTQEKAHVRAKRFDFCVLEQGCGSDLHNRSVSSGLPKESLKSQAISGGMQKQGGSSVNPLKEVQKAEKSAQKEIKSIKSDIEGFKKLF
tara:strand:+ start:345 stop:1013 length:669 start_codon:yes stop_codon:yes gene_type:complete